MTCGMCLFDYSFGICKIYCQRQVPVYLSLIIFSVVHCDIINVIDSTERNYFYTTTEIEHECRYILLNNKLQYHVALIFRSVANLPKPTK